jgi:hypothetical protein
LLIAPIETLLPLLLLQPFMRRLAGRVIRIPGHGCLQPKDDGLRWSARRSAAGTLQNKPPVAVSVRPTCTPVNPVSNSLS